MNTVFVRAAAVFRTNSTSQKQVADQMMLVITSSSSTTAAVAQITQITTCLDGCTRSQHTLPAHQTISPVHSNAPHIVVTHVLCDLQHQTDVVVLHLHKQAANQLKPLQPCGSAACGGSKPTDASLPHLQTAHDVWQLPIKAHVHDWADDLRGWAQET